jgi:polar amino acid transport system substrate-binding protein
VAEKTTINCSFRASPIDIIFGGMSVTEARKKLVDFADPFITVDQTVLLNSKHMNPVKPYKDLDDAKIGKFEKPLIVIGLP